MIPECRHCFVDLLTYRNYESRRKVYLQAQTKTECLQTVPFVSSILSLSDCCPDLLRLVYG